MSRRAKSRRPYRKAGDNEPLALIRRLVDKRPTHGYRLQNFRSEEAKMLNLEEPIFCHPNGRPIGSFKKGFEQALNEAGVLRGSDGKKRVPYSLRHTYATMRISEGVSVFQLAANMGTSVEMIESFYGKKRMRDPKMATEVTKFRGR